MLFHRLRHRLYPVHFQLLIISTRQGYYLIMKALSCPGILASDSWVLMVVDRLLRDDEMQHVQSNTFLTTHHFFYQLVLTAKADNRFSHNPHICDNRIQGSSREKSDVQDLFH
jgi:hypothetical protein